MQQAFYLDNPRQYSELSLRDLVRARDQYHVHLMRHRNVVATAVGYYRIRKEDSWPNEKKHHKGTRPRTLENSEVRPYSWPCVLVFVEHWLHPHDFGARGGARLEDLVPPTLDLIDGRKVPVCVVLAPKEPKNPDPPLDIRYPTNNIGGGWPVMAEVQGVTHVATIACLVRDGHKYYALTNRHVSGDAGEVLYSILDGRKERIGVSDERQLTRLPFGELYDDTAGRNVMVNMDIGLIELDDVNRWTAKVKDLGEMGAMVDIGQDNVGLHLVGQPVTGQGAATGLVRGEVYALFYRYQSRAGMDHVADVLIGPRNDKDQRKADKAAAQFTVRPGDSGRLFMIEVSHKDGPMTYHPFAVQWGAQYLGDPDNVCGYALATFLSTVCERLDVDPVRDWNLDAPNTWGAVGHFSIATCMSRAISSASPKLKQLLQKHVGIISHPDSVIRDPDQAFEGMGDDPFVPMADVPDFYWKHGKQGGDRPYEGSNHFADMDHPRQGDGMTLIEFSRTKSNLDPAKWNAFIDDIRDEEGKKIASNKRGLLPFRVWQIVDEMIGFAQKRADHAKFICAAGNLAHYLGDACQPLHMSYLFDGDPDNMVPGPRGGKPKPFGAGVHHAYEADMFDLKIGGTSNRDRLMDALAAVDKVKAAELVTSGHEAAHAVLKLMLETMRKLPPRKLVDTYGRDKKLGTEALWRAYGRTTLTQMTKGVHLLAVLVESAWKAGGGEAKASTSLSITRKRAMEICADENYLRSYQLRDITSVLKA